MQYSIIDFSLEEIIITYNEIEIKVYNPTIDCIQVIKCHGFISIEYMGQWDENILEKLIVRDDTPKIRAIKDFIASQNNTSHLGGGVRDFDRNWEQLELYLLDGVVITVIGQSFELPFTF